MNGNGGCKKCSGVYIKTFDELVKEFTTVHGDKFIYDEETKTTYKTCDSVLKICCPKHGYFDQSIGNHLNSGRCDDCEEETINEKYQIKFNSIDKTKKIYVHPNYTNYSINIDTDILTNIKTKRQSKGTIEKRGTIAFTITITDERYTISLHRFKYEAVYNEIVPDDSNIDHRNAKPSDNTIENLQCLTILEHGRKTQRDNPDRGKKVGKTQSVSGTAYNPTTEVTIEFDSIIELSEKIDSSPGNIHRFLSGRSNSSPKGYSEITFNEYEKIEGEVWKKHPVLTFEVSNMGRIKNRRRISNGTLDGQKEYYMYSGKKVHQLVMETFGSEQPGPDYTVDHINIIKTDNRIGNLRWATKSEQCFNRSTSKSYFPRKINGYTGEIMAEYSSITDVMKKEQITNGVVHTISSRKRDWFINLKPDDLNKNRLQFVYNVLNSSKCNGNDINGFSGCVPDGTPSFWEYQLNSSKFSENKKTPMYRIRRQKRYKNSYDDIKKKAIENNNAKIIQCYYRSFIKFKI